MSVVWKVYSFLVTLGLRSQPKFWGIVYDSVTKQPLDPAVVKLVYLYKDKSQTAITDLQGRYGFLAEPGKFKILVWRTNYKFPSTIVKGAQDGIYDSVYHGELFELRNSSEVIGPNIPLDPLQSDWNQVAKQKIINYSPYTLKLKKAVTEVVFWTGFTLCVIFLAISYKNPPVFWAVVAGLYILLFAVALMINQPRLWGHIRLKGKNMNPVSVELELQNPEIPGIVLGKAVVSPEGKFLLLAQPGSYTLHAKISNQNGELVEELTVPVRLPGNGVLYQSFTLKG